MRGRGVGGARGRRRRRRWSTSRFGGVPGVGGGDAAEPLGEEVVRQADRCRRRGGGGLVLAQPLPLGGCHGGDGHRAGPRQPGVGAAERVGEVGGLRRGAGVVPEQCGAQGAAGGVEDDQAVLLSGDRDPGDGGGGHPGFLQSPGDGFSEGGPPLLGVALARPAGSGDGVPGAADREQGAGGGIDHGCLGGLRGAVHTDHHGVCRRHGVHLSSTRPLARSRALPY